MLPTLRERAFPWWRIAVLQCLWLLPICTAVGQNSPDEEWIDKTHSIIYDTLWRSAMGLDRYFGSQEPAEVYQKLYGSISPALLWDEVRGFQPKLRFQVNFPLPQLNNRFNAIVGRVNPDEFVTESAQQSGAIQRQFGPVTEDQTVFGIAYQGPAQAGGFGLGAGIRIRSPLDPYLKGDYTYAHGTPQGLLLITRQTLFWEASEHLGVTTRIDLDHFLSEQALLRFATAATLSQKSQGLRGYAAATLLRSLAERRAVVCNLSADWETRAPVSLHEFGAAAAYRQGIYRDWLILELRSSLTWPKLTPEAARTRSWGLGIGVEMLLGTTQFQARPVTF
jgi:hypothetical protein